MAMKEKCTAQHVSNISSNWVYMHLLVASQLFLFFTGPAFEWECFHTFACEVGRGLSGLCEFCVLAVSKKKSQGLLNVK